MRAVAVPRRRRGRRVTAGEALPLALGADRQLLRLENVTERQSPGPRASDAEAQAVLASQDGL